jgi:pimeloyl-ACP methyl ester carboxylesterase
MSDTDEKHASNNLLRFSKFGHGPKTLLAFHGIGQDGLHCFQCFGEPLGAHYTIYAFDLFFHGQSGAISENVISKEFWTATIHDFLHQNHITRFDIAGFSIGGRFALATLEALAGQVDNVFLIAPDGVSEHPLYTLASRFWPTRMIFKKLLKYPEVLFKMSNVLQKAGLISSSLNIFTQKVLDSPEKRQSVYHSWVSFRKLRFDVSYIFKLTKQNEVTIHLFVGKFDKLLKPKHVRKLAELLPEHQYHELKSGHTKLVAQAGSYIANLF